MFFLRTVWRPVWTLMLTQAHFSDFSVAKIANPGCQYETVSVCLSLPAAALACNRAVHTAAMCRRSIWFELFFLLCLRVRAKKCRFKCSVAHQYIQYTIYGSVDSDSKGVLNLISMHSDQPWIRTRSSSLPPASSSASSALIRHLHARPPSTRSPHWPQAGASACAT